MAPGFALFQRLLQGGGRARRFAPSSLIDTATNPKTYQGLAQSASDTLGRALPPQFRGAGFQNVSPKAFSALDDAAAAPFAGPVRQQVLDKASKEFAKKAGPGVTRVPVMPTGGQPVNPTAVGRYTTLPPSAPLTNAQKLMIGSGATGTGALTGGALTQPFNQTVEQRLNQVGSDVDNFVSGLNFPGKQFLSDLGKEQEKKGFAGVLELGTPFGFLAAPFMPNSQVGSPRNYGEKYKEQELAAFQKAALHQPPTPVTAPPVQLPQKPIIQPPQQTQQPQQVAPVLPTPVDPSIGRTVTQQDVKPAVVDTSTQLPASAEQTYIDPYAYQLQVYGQGRNAAQTQSDWDKITKLGLAIHRDKYPQFYNNTSMSYQMRETFPDRSTQSLENTIQEKGVQLPGSMIDADSTNELLRAQEEQRIYQLDEATADVEALLKEIAARKQR
jgi:hypothetical protein